MTKHITYNWKIVKLRTRGKRYGVRLNGRIRARANTPSGVKRIRNRMIDAINRRARRSGARVASDRTGRRFS